MIKSGKSFIKIGSRLQITFFYFIKISTPTPLPPAYSKPPIYLMFTLFIYLFICNLFIVGKFYFNLQLD